MNSRIKAAALEFSLCWDSKPSSECSKLVVKIEYIVKQGTFYVVIIIFPEGNALLDTLFKTVKTKKTKKN